MAYLTEEERKKPFSHVCDYFIFESCVDLSIGIKATPIVPDKSNEMVNPDIIARDVATLTTWWIMNILPTLNGFSGIDTIKWDFENKK